MRVLIGESKIKDLAYRWLVDNFGDLKLAKQRLRYGDEIYEVYRYVMEGNRAIIVYVEDTHTLQFSYRHAGRMLMDLFGLEEDEAKELITALAKDRYGINITRFTSARWLDDK